MSRLELCLVCVELYHYQQTGGTCKKHVLCVDFFIVNYQNYSCLYPRRRETSRREYCSGRKS